MLQLLIQRLDVANNTPSPYTEGLAYAQNPYIEDFVCTNNVWYKRYLAKLSLIKVGNGRLGVCKKSICGRYFVYKIVGFANDFWDV